MRIKHIDALRGLAALMVTFFHLTHNSIISKDIASYGSYGWLGVEIFFVISGFVLPYSMFKSGYQVKQLGNFMLKRIIRVYPAYLVAIMIGIGIEIITYPGTFTGAVIFFHLFFLNEILHYTWISPVFWTLAIEFQFYLLIGLLYSNFSKSTLRSILLIVFLIICGFILDRYVGAATAYITHWFPFFALGILLFNKKATNMHTIAYWVATVIILAYTTIQIGVAESIAAAFAVLFIQADRINTNLIIMRVLLWVGKISFSLYLVHWELGRLAVRVARRIPIIGNNDIARLTIGVLFSILSALLLYIFVEKPSMLYASKLKYKVKGSSSLNENIGS